LLTLHIEAATYMELRAKTIAALHAHLGDEAAAPAATPAPTPAPEEPKRRTPKAKADAAPVTPATPVAKKNDDDNDLRRRFESLVNTDYDSALSILDALGVPNFKAAADGGMLDQLALAMEAFA
jgi:hypothetical protein